MSPFKCATSFLLGPLTNALCFAIDAVTVHMTEPILASKISNCHLLQRWICSLVSEHEVGWCSPLMYNICTADEITAFIKTHTSAINLPIFSLIPADF